MSKYRYPIVIERVANGIHAYVPALPECHAYGNDKDQVCKELRETIDLYMANLEAAAKTNPDAAEKLRQLVYARLTTELVRNPLTGTRTLTGTIFVNRK